MIVDRQTHTHVHRQTDTLVTIVCCPIGGGSKTVSWLFRRTDSTCAHDRPLAVSTSQLQQLSHNDNNNSYYYYYY